MGAKQTKDATSDDLHHYKINTVELTNEGTDPVMKAKIAVDESQYKTWKEKLEKVSLSREFLLIPRTNSYKSSGLCSNFGEMTATYDRKSFLLSEEMESRKAKNQYFDERQLWYLIYVLNGAQNEMKHKLNSKVGDIRPENIFSKEDGMAVVGNLLSWPGQNSSYELARDTNKSFLAPEDMHRIQMGGLEKMDDFNAEIFSIGLTLLSVSTLSDFSHLYNYRSCRFDVEEARHCIEDWKRNKVYSPIYTAFVANMCEIEPEHRLSELELTGFVSEYEKQLKAFADFTIFNVPPTVQHEVATLLSGAVQQAPVSEAYQSQVPKLQSASQYQQQLPFGLQPAPQRMTFQQSSLQPQLSFQSQPSYQESATTNSVYSAQRNTSSFNPVLSPRNSQMPANGGLYQQQHYLQ